MKYILRKLTSTNTPITLEFTSHSSMMSHILRMMKEEPGAMVVELFILNPDGTRYHWKEPTT